MRPRRGAALIEALAATVVLALSAATITRAVLGLAANVGAISKYEHQIQQASRLLSAHALLRRDELLKREGRTTLGEFTIDVRRASERCARIGVEPSGERSTALATIVCHESDR